MSKTFAVPLVSLVAFLALTPAKVAAQGFDLPPAPTPSPSSSPVYGPQDPDRPTARPIPVPTPRQTPAARPTPTPQPTASPAPTAATQRPVVEPLSTPRATTGSRSNPTPERRPRIEENSPATEPSPSTESTVPTPAPAIDPTPTSAPPGRAGSGAPPAVGDNEKEGLPWLWIMLGALAIALAGVFTWWRRREGPGSLSVPEIERPTPVKLATNETERAPKPPATVADPSMVAQVPTPPKPVAAAFDNGPLHVAFEVRDITATLMAVTLHYRITVSNRGRDTLTELLVGGVLEAARDDLAIEQQLQAPQGKLPAAHNAKNVAGGAVIELSGEFRVPLSQLNPIRRGQQALFVPIVRLRAAAASGQEDPIIAQQSILLGRVDQGPELMPIRLDQGPRVYREIGQRIVTQQAA